VKYTNNLICLPSQLIPSPEEANAAKKIQVWYRACKERETLKVIVITLSHFIVTLGGNISNVVGRCGVVGSTLAFMTYDP